MQRKCVKCGHTNLDATGSDTEECPSCGVIYAKAVATASRPITPAMQARQASTARASGFGSTRPAPAVDTPDLVRASFVDQMRAESLYPTFRAFTQMGYIIGLVVAGVIAVGAVLAFFKSGPVLAAGSMCAAIFVWLVSRAFKETSLMLADMSDAMVRMAAKQGG